VVLTFSFFQTKISEKVTGLFSILYFLSRSQILALSKIKKMFFSQKNSNQFQHSSGGRNMLCFDFET
jgi:hypothetical protein